MDRLERELRSALADDRLSLPLRPDAAHLVGTGVRRRRRNRVIASAAAVVVVASGAVAVSTTVSSGGGTDRIVPPADLSPTPTTAHKPPRPAATSDEVPWAATAYDYHHPPAFPGAVADPSVPWCRASQLSLSTQPQPAGGVDMGTAVTNASTSTCALQGQPKAAVLAGARVLVTSNPEPFYVDQWVRLAPQHRAFVDVTWGGQYCGRSAPTDVTLDLPHAGGKLSAPMTHSPACNSTNYADNGQLVARGFVSNAGSAFTPLAGLTATIDKASTTSHPGGLVTYRLQLQSPSTRDVALKPCLPYRERLVNSATGQIFEEDHLLNCPAAPQTVGDPVSNRSTYFDMQIAVPTNAPAGSYALIWQSVFETVNAFPDSDVQISAATPECIDGQITASDGGRGQAMSQYGQVVVLRNVSSSACSLRGYPGVELVDGTGQPIGEPAARAGGYMFQDPGPSTIVLAPGTGVASFTFGGAAYDNVRQHECPSSAAAVVYPPGLRQSLQVPMSEPYCPEGITTSAVVAGTKGSAP